MPKLLHFIPCASPLVDLLTGRLSVILILDTVQAAVSSPDPNIPQQLPESRFVLAPFSISTHWWIDGETHGQQFEQHVSITAPDGRETQVTPDVQFAFETHYHRVIQQTGVVTARMAGIFQLSLKLRKAGEIAWKIFGTYPILVQEPQMEQQALMLEAAVSPQV